MADKMATREAYGNTLKELGAKYPNLVVMDADLSGSTKTSVFAKEYPERFFNMGIAEQNMYGAAAGLALSGKIVCASTFAMFASGRAFEIIRNSIGYTHLNFNEGTFKIKDEDTYATSHLTLWTKDRHEKWKHDAYVYGFNNYKFDIYSSSVSINRKHYVFLVKNKK